MTRNILVTGGSSGIGQAIVEERARKGDNVLFTYRTVSKKDAVKKFANDLSQLHGVKVKATRADVTITEDQDKLLRVSKEFFGQLPDVLVNNAGIISLDSFLNVTNDQVMAVMNTNFLAPFILTQKIARAWVEAQKMCVEQNKDLKDYVIVFIGSISGKVPTGLGIYECSKAAIEMLNNALGYELSGYGIRSGNIETGLVCTGIE